MKISDEIYVAGWNKAEDWRALRTKLVAGSERGLWRNAFKDYFLKCLDLRYLGPIKVLQDHSTFQGEGFSIVAIQCTLIEFLESTFQGINYRYLRRGERLGQYEYSFSRQLFISFLSNRQPFARDFDETLARDFYECVRCGLLHEARTKNGWRIWAKSPFGIVANAAERILYRDNFQAAILELIDWYKKALPDDINLQKALIRKFDSLCE
jgi:hypothetical protein